MPSVAFHTLGCKVNHYETEAIWQLFQKQGYDRRDFEKTADVYVINTCTVTNTGDQKSRQVIRRAIRSNPDAVICVTGCYAQTSPAEVLSIPGVDIVVGTQDRSRLLDFVDQYRKEREPINGVSDIMKAKVYEELDVPVFTDRTRASLKIQEGCNNFCTFCIIPWARGLLRSRTPENVLKQAQQLVNAGYREIVLTGIHTAGYGEDMENYSFAQLLRDLERNVDGLKRLRISSIEASQITDEVVDVIHRSHIVARHLHIPLQSGSDGVLKRMHRKYTTAFFADKIAGLRRALPDFALTSDVIVGFPGETDEEFEETCDFIRRLKFSELHVFPYSQRTGTPAARMADQVPVDVKHRRVERLIGLSNRLSEEYAAKYKGSVLEVIPEEPLNHHEQDGYFVGFTDNYLKVKFHYPSRDIIGKLVRVKITETGYPINEGRFVRILDDREQPATTY
ncbi:MULTISPECIES: tRNA (N(6)-L-threonylcarbamoyladenosine(37)-C(2))-methylthiotransferase MtaB [unclassified Sporolactobacillus]|uniref:tRNA (N(6)-L-threonylcarbamoyladenosine(37)-C(2))- methylthiotransferase MtaB n=1 Tax=unclassified Sporolactobacillus TaxID=2628533 RepID=UPI0023682918|nr:tRNA (N(6)-L-threonylcarbamoyladenosine(37)-C(2))-methylthiotransferase MtaB [Sporolactobacillus sp. CQH2019]MDD9147596.1 tRNA (N(6)-L-threonylcarbamoyladenosine(37)-C(2))-methylthiotransferase MtaB [Sporolactobacillus sp. CQH2019]